MIYLYALFGALVASSAVAKTITNDHWAGVVNFDEDIIEVSGDIVVPDCSPGLPYQSFSDYTTDGWVGINGWDLPPAPNAKELKKGGLLQTGVTCNANAIYHKKSSTYTRAPTSYQVWTEWAPAGPIFFNHTDVQAGDIVRASVKKLSATSGSTYLKNLRTGKEYTHEFVDQSHELLNQTNAEWITETETYIIPQLGLAQGVLTANFTEWRFEHAQYCTSDGKTHQACSPYLVNCVLNGTQIAAAKLLSPGMVIVKNTTPDNFTLQVG